jgi:hypothetical protein
MPAVVQNIVDGYVSCRDGRCPGYKQEPCQVKVTETQFSYMDLGGDIPGIERSTYVWTFADEDDIPCPHCGQPRMCSEQERPIYPNVSGVPQDAILMVGRDSERVRDMMLEGAQRDTQMAQNQALMERMSSQLERQERQIEQLSSELASRPRGPGRPRKVEDE